MQYALGASPQALLQALMQAGEPQILDQLYTARVAGLSRSALLRQLRGLVEQGLVRRRGERKAAVYEPNQRAAVSWLACLGHRWMQIEWTQDGLIDWRFPLVGRIQSSVARQVVTKFLDLLEDEGINRPWNIAKARWDRGDFDVTMAGWREDQKTAFRRSLMDRDQYGPLTVAVFGSTARGEDREDSDIDVFVDAPPDAWARPSRFAGPADVCEDAKIIAFRDVLADLAAQLNLGAPRPVDIHVGSLGPSLAMSPPVPRTIRDAVKRDGITVYTTGSTNDFVERRRPADG